MKRKAWEEIAEKTNAVNCSNYVRSGEEIKKKWTFMSSESKKKLSLNKREQRKTGGGSLPSGAQITPMDEKIEDEQAATIKSVPAKRKRRYDAESEDSTSKLVNIEQERLLVEKQRLRVEEDRLGVERKRLEVEEERLKLQKEKHNLYLCQMGIISSVDVSVQPESEKH
ncbi:myb/SANT-like DNA-binding domain-containing protein 4 [Saccostrea cucullata]|uniref:myb/SANT-like DNA-binding domain-containing protein 4 n=1 Tax=Saccostrea cuccullata TaxID=36930 RepID=UPI002ED5EAE2